MTKRSVGQVEQVLIDDVVVSMQNTGLYKKLIMNPTSG